MKKYNEDEWKTHRDATIRRLINELEKGLVDSEIANWLYTFNTKHNDVYTSSSCSGRVVVMYGKSFLNKKDARIVCACHRPVNCHRYLCSNSLEISSLIEKEGLVAWAALHPPIIHFVTINEKVSENIISCALSSGFIHSGMRRSRKLGHIIEIRAFDKLHILLPASCSLLLSLCEVLETYKSRLNKFISCIDAQI